MTQTFNVLMTRQAQVDRILRAPLSLNWASGPDRTVEVPDTPPLWEQFMSKLGRSADDVLAGRLTQDERSRVRSWLRRNARKRFAPEAVLVVFGVEVG